MRYYVLNSELKNSCEFNPDLFKEIPSIYEVLRVEDGIPLFLKDHIIRFFNSVFLSKAHCQITELQIINRIKGLIQANGMQMGLIKFVCTNHPVSGNIFAAWVTPFFFPSEHTFRKGINMISYGGSRENPNTKVSHQKIREQSNHLIQKNKVYEILLLNQQRIITEGSRSNLFFIDHGILCTAHPKFGLKGVTRQKIIDIAMESGIDVLESAFFLPEIVNFQAAFITGTTPKVLSVRKIDSVTFHVYHPIIKHLTEKYNNLIAEYKKTFSWQKP